tara:strand:+ start:234 stop:1436 length:1203 start_codon:yes stop_codon:yes gene_type:complete
MIKQAVIFCGGIGSRLQKITKLIPKPMVQVCGKPFLEHLIIQLKKNGIQEVILLIGYKGHLIKKYFLDGKNFNIKISYSFLPSEYKTGSRLYKIKSKLNKKFLLLYCDNYSSINLHKLNDKLLKSKKDMIISLSRKKKGNCKLNKDMTISYDFNRNLNNNFVEIGYMILKKEILKKLKKEDENFSDFIGKLSKKKLITGHIQENGYASIGDSKRLNLTRKLFANNNYILIDRDGVLNHKSKNQRYITKAKDLNLNKSLCKKLPTTAKLICITNQAGLSTKELSLQSLKKINFKIKKYLNKIKLKLEKFYISHHHFTSKSYFRKPNPGFFLKAAKDFNFILDKTFYIGDDKRDIEAAYNANTFIFYVGKDELTLEEKKKYNLIILNNTIKKTYNEKKKFRF